MDKEVYLKLKKLNEKQINYLKGKNQKIYSMNFEESIEFVEDLLQENMIYDEDGNNNQEGLFIEKIIDILCED